MIPLDKSLNLLISLRNFLLELRNAHAHFSKKLFVLYWGETTVNPKKPKIKFKFKFELSIPVSKKKGGIEYNFKSHDSYKLTFIVNPGKALRVDKKFIYKIILLSYHLIKLFSYRKTKTYQVFLNKYKPCLKKLETKL